MQLLGPDFTTLRDNKGLTRKHSKRNMMKLYSQHGINPAGGCLPCFADADFVCSVGCIKGHQLICGKLIFSSG